MGLFSIFRRGPAPLPLVVATKGFLLPGVTAEAPYWDTFKIEGNEGALRTALSSGEHIVVAFRTAHGLHSEGVLAVITGSAPFEKRIDSAGYGASQRYTFVAVARCKLFDVLGEKVPARVRVERMPDRADDAVTLPLELERRYEILARSGGWQRSFELCKGKPLGYWILYALRGEPKLEWFESPTRVIPAIDQLVTRMLPIVDPETRRAAIAAQLAPRTVSVLPERTVTVGCDVAAWVLLHPVQCHDADVETTSNTLLDSAAMHERFARHLMVAVNTGGDGVFAVRFTAGTLTDEERARARESCDFPLDVKHGRLFLWGEVTDLDSSDLGANPESWIDLPNGTYCVRVTVLDSTDEGPDYVVQLHPTTTPPPAPHGVPRLDAWG